MGQSINLNVTTSTSNNNRSTFLLKRGAVTINNGQIQFQQSGKTVDGYTAYGISPDKSIVSLLKWSGGTGHVVLFNSKGDTLTAYPTITMADRTSFGIYPFNNGDILLRDKIADFTFCNTFGDIITNMSNSSKSKEGEAISEVSMSSGGKTVVIYSPKIKHNGTLGSKAVVKRSDNRFENVFYSSDRYLKDVTVSKDGNMIAAITSAKGSRDKVLLMDKYGENLTNITTKVNLKGVSLSENGKYIALYSSSRVMVYSVTDGDRLGSTSFRNPIYLAHYFPEDHLILALTGDYSKAANALGNVAVKAISLTKRKITDKDFSGILGFNKSIESRLIHTSKGHYKLIGASKELEISTNL